MSIALTTVVIVSMILPGVFFSVGFYTPERNSRDIARSGTLGEIGIAIFAALIAHLAAILVIRYLLGNFADTTLYHFLLSLDPEVSKGERFLYALSSFHIIIFYLISLPVLTFLVGLATGKLVVRGCLRVLVSHKWVYDLLDISSSSSLVLCYILTKIVHDGKYLAYKGYLKEFHVSENGEFSYIIIEQCEKFFLDMAKVSPKTSVGQLPLPLGWANLYGANVGEADSPYLLVMGRDISNVFFERLYLEITKDGKQSLGNP